ncbi:COG1496: Uncharacterized conserved protein [Pseudoalteromonas luteoviolacea B = ATCC 29581]|nr:COG1496: Uncharacterized conserved protein [Pseudoalteromonas luteoviolacea B = ATCC 29581]
MVLRATWPTSTGIETFSTTRCLEGVSVAPFDRFNLAYHVGDDKSAVTENRARFTAMIGSKLIWLDQIHGDQVVHVTEENRDKLSEMPTKADGLFTRLDDTALTIMTADCLPILLSSEDGKEIAALHGGWRPLQSGIIENALALFSSEAHTLRAWFGPAIGPRHFEVGNDVRDAFCLSDPIHQAAFVSHPMNSEKWLADIFMLATQKLNRLGVEAIYSQNICTVSQPERFYSYRREGRTGRMATVIWRK